ncbi:MAG: choice-of-anchor Q domain-containing protein [bacterium JZ-2024 1]
MKGLKEIPSVLIFLAGLLLFDSLPVYAQQWAKTYGGPASDEFFSIQQTADGGFIVAGNSDSFGAHPGNFWVLKLDPAGNVAWQKLYSGELLEYAYSVQQTADGGYIVAGWTQSFGAGNADFWVLKLDGSGNVVWQKTYGGASNEHAYAIQQTVDGGYIVTGWTFSFGAGRRDLWILKLDGSGNVVWQKTYGGTGDEWAESIQQTADGGFIVAGSTESFGAGNADFWVLKLDGSGNVVWQKTYGGTSHDFGYTIQQTADGGFIVAGSTESFGAGIVDFWALKLDGSGHIVWQKTYGGASDEYAYAIQQTADGGYIVAGYTGSFTFEDFLVLKLDSLGNLVWQKTYGVPGSDFAYSVQQIADGGYIVAGASGALGSGGRDSWVLRLNASGDIPGCSVIGTPGVTSQGTSATVVNTNISPTDTAVSGLNSSGTTTDTSAATTTVCEAACSLVVDTTQDVVNAGDSVNSLREAILCANATPGADTIHLPAGTYTLTIAGQNEDAGATGDLDITDDLTLTGANRSTTIIDANFLERAFDILHIPPASAPVVNISGITVMNGNAPYGAGIYNGGNLTLLDMVVRNNATVQNGDGGGLFNAGSAVITGVFFESNQADGRGGGIFNEGFQTLEVRKSRLSQNLANGGGGAIFNEDGTLTVTESILSSNSALNGNGGAIDNFGSGARATIIGSRLDNNSANNGSGGAIDNGSVEGAGMTIATTTIAANSALKGGGISNTGDLRMETSTLSENASRIDGGGVYNTGFLEVLNSTISGNASQTTDSGGGLYNTGFATLSFTTVTGNSGNPGGGILSAGGIGAIVLKASIVAGNTADNCAVISGGTITSSGYNLGGDASCDPFFTDPTDLRSRDPKLGVLANNGGPTQTHALNTGSPAIDVVPTANCTDAQGNPLTTDQRGEPRPYGPACDIGAFEVQQVQQFTLAITIAGTGNGGVMGTGISCTKSGGVVSGDCSEPFTAGTNVILNAGANTGSTFAGWSGDCTGTNTTTTVLMDANKTCTATFNLIPPPTLTITIGPNSPPQGTQYGKGQSNRPMLQFVMTASSGNAEAVRVTSVTLRASGTGNDQTGVIVVKVWLDANGNGQVDAGDTQLGSGTYNADNATLAITFTTAQVLPAGQSRTFLVTYDFAP